MKTLLTGLTVLALAGAAPAPASAAPANPAAPLVSDLRARLKNAIDQVAQKAAARGATRADFQRVVDELTAAAKEYDAENAEAAPLRQRIAARLDELEQKSRAAAVEAVEFDYLRDQLIQLDLDNALARLKARALGGEWSREQYQAVLDALTARAQAAIGGNPELDAIVARAKAALEAIKSRGAQALKENDFQPIVDPIHEIAINLSVANLEKSALSKRALEADYEDVRAAIKVGMTDAALREKALAKLEELKAAVKGGRITREQFAEFKSQLMTRARSASK